MQRAGLCCSVLLFAAACVYLQHRIYTELGAVVTTAPYAHLRDRELRLEQLMRIGNASATHAPPPARRYLTFCTMIKDEARYLREWIEFHSLLGVENFIVYDNGSRDGPEAALNGTLASVDIIKWPPPQWPADNPHRELCQGYVDGTNREPWAMADCQIAAFHDCAARERGRSRWIAAVDVDEFYMPNYRKRLQTLPDALAPYEHMDGMRLNSFTYGTGHRQTALGDGELIIETHTLRRDEEINFKEFVNPLKIDTYYHVHMANYNNVLWNLPIMKDIPRQHAHIRFNHYAYRSVAEIRHKAVRNWNPGVFYNIEAWDNADIDDPFMIPMVPLIRRRLAGERIWVSPAPPPARPAPAPATSQPLAHLRLRAPR